MRITLDPWGGDYASELAIPDGADNDDSAARVADEQIEDRPWVPIDSQPPTSPTVTAVVDGVMRSDALGMVNEGRRSALALFGSYAAGAVVIGAPVQVVERKVDRLLIIGGNWLDPDSVELPSSTGASLVYEGMSSSAETYEEVRSSLIEEMRRAEAQVAETLAARGYLVLADGNLSFYGGGSSVVGVIKRVQRIYLSTEKARILEKLQTGQRTPLFRIESGRKSGGYDVFSCYLRLAQPQSFEVPLAGLVRLEVNASLSEEVAVPLLEQAAKKVRELASRAPKDPRAPQNLIPVGGLERDLRHRLGDPQLVLRRIRQKLRAVQE